MATISAPRFCAECNKTFKNLRLHMVKAHERITVKILGLSWCAAEDPDDWVMPIVTYNDRVCVPTDGWDSAPFFTQLYEFPQEIIDQNNNEYFGLEVTFTAEGRLHSVSYARHISNIANCGPDVETTKPIANNRILEIVQHTP